MRRIGCHVSPICVICVICGPSPLVRGEEAFCQCYVVLAGDLNVDRVAWGDFDRSAPGFDEGGFVGRFGAGEIVFGVGSAQGLEHCALRSLDRGETCQRLAVDRGGSGDRGADETAGVRPLNGIGERKAGDRRAGSDRGGDDAVDQCAADQGTGGVVNEHDLDVLAKRIQPASDGRGAGLAARYNVDWAGSRASGGGGARSVKLVFPGRNDDSGDAGMRGKGGQSPFQNAQTAECSPYLILRATESFSPSRGGYNHCCSGRRYVHSIPSHPADLGCRCSRNRLHRPRSVCAQISFSPRWSAARSSL